jgi:CheY-like chemotaxis protein
VITSELEVGTTDVLVVDDDPDVRAALEQLLTDEGFTVVAASDGAQGLQFADIWPPRVVLLDIHMPVLDGRGFLAAWRIDPNVADIPVAILSSEPIDRTILDQADGWMTKPVDAERVLATVTALLLGGRAPRSAGQPAADPDGAERDARQAQR